MKLIDLLVQELPKRGGWPDGADCCCISGVDYDGVTIQFRFIHRNNQFLFCPDADHIYIPYQGNATEFITSQVITKEVYQSALAASQNHPCNGEGVPPVGCECEYLDNNGKWYPVTIKYASNQLVVISGITKILGVEQGTEIAKDIIIDKPQFRPLRTESERRHEAVLESICAVLEMAAQDYKRSDEAKLIYEAIAAGKIPGVKLDD